jgi:hypothetical protein
MRVGTFNLFDETISGTANTWLTPNETWEPLGRGDLVAFSASVYNVTGSPTPSLSVQVEHSADGQNWTTANASPEINGTIASNTVLNGKVYAGLPVLLHFVRLRVQMTGTAPVQCRLKLAATTRNY